MTTDISTIVNNNIISAIINIAVQGFLIITISLNVLLTTTVIIGNIRERRKRYTVYVNGVIERQKREEHARCQRELTEIRIEVNSGILDHLWKLPPPPQVKRYYNISIFNFDVR